MRNRITNLRSALEAISHDTDETGPTHAAEMALAALQVDNIVADAEGPIEKVTHNCPVCGNYMPAVGRKYGGHNLRACVNRECPNNRMHLDSGARAYA